MINTGAISEMMQIQTILLYYKAQMDEVFTKIGVKPTFTNRNISEKNIGLKSVVLYDYLLPDGVEDDAETFVDASELIPESSTNTTATSATSATTTNETTETQESSKNIDNTTGNADGTSLSGSTIQNLFPPTIQLTSIDFEVNAPEETKAEIAQHIGVFPFIYYSGLEIRPEDITMFRLSSNGVLPSFSLTFHDSMGFIKDGGMPLDDTKS